MNWWTLPFERIVIYKSKIFAKRFKPGKSPKIWLKRASSLRIFLRQNPSIWVIVPWNLISVLMSYPNFQYSADLFSSAFPSLSCSNNLWNLRWENPEAQTGCVLTTTCAISDTGCHIVHTSLVSTCTCLVCFIFHLNST